VSDMFATTDESLNYYRSNYERLREERERAQAAGCALREHRDIEGALTKMRGERDRLIKTVGNLKTTIQGLRSSLRWANMLREANDNLNRIKDLEEKLARKEPDQ